MLQYIDQVLVPYVAQKPPNTECILILDTLQAHILIATKEKLSELGVTLYIIPGVAPH